VESTTTKEDTTTTTSEDLKTEKKESILRKVKHSNPPMINHSYPFNPVYETNPPILFKYPPTQTDKLPSHPLFKEPLKAVMIDQVNRHGVNLSLTSTKLYSR
jgi:hypothetical protein